MYAASAMVQAAGASVQSLTLSAGKGNIYFSSDTVTTKRIKDVSIQSASEVEFTNKLNANKISVTAEKITLTQTAKLDTAETAVFSNSGILLLEPGCSIEASTITQDGSGKNQIPENPSQCPLYLLHQLPSVRHYPHNPPRQQIYVERNGLWSTMARDYGP